MVEELQIFEPLRDGEELLQPEFHDRYELMPDSFRAELIAGRV